MPKNMWQQKELSSVFSLRPAGQLFSHIRHSVTSSIKTYYAGYELIEAKLLIEILTFMDLSNFDEIVAWFSQTKDPTATPRIKSLRVSQIVLFNLTIYKQYIW